MTGQTTKTLLDGNGSSFLGYFWDDGTAFYPMPLNPGAYGKTAALASNLILKASPGVLFGFDVVGDSTAIAATWYVMVFDATSLPANGAITPVKCYPVAAGNPLFSADFGSGGIAFTTGITIGISSTGPFTQTTLGAHAFISGSFK